MTSPAPRNPTGNPAPRAASRPTPALALEIIDPGPATTVQDLGRPGLMRYGAPAAGALDRDALRLANALAGAEPGAAALEIRYLGPSLRASGGPIRAALAGATVLMRLERADGSHEDVGAGRSFTLNDGDRLRTGPLRGRSATAYLAVSGGIATPPILGSRATYARSRLGGVDGRPLRASDRVPVGAAAPGGPERALTRLDEPVWAGRARVVLGPQDDRFTEEAVALFLSTDWRVSRDADRMGLRLVPPEDAGDGAAARLALKDGHDIVSDGVAEGSVQVPGSGLPIVLLADRQTSGGYPKIATVIGADTPALGRARPGDAIRFDAVSPAEAVRLRRAAEARLAAEIAAIRAWRPEGGLDLDALYRENLISGPVADG